MDFLNEGTEIENLKTDIQDLVKAQEQIEQEKDDLSNEWDEHEHAKEVLYGDLQEARKKNIVVSENSYGNFEVGIESHLIHIPSVMEEISNLNSEISDLRTQFTALSDYIISSGANPEPIGETLARPLVLEIGSEAARTIHTLIIDRELRVDSDLYDDLTDELKWLYDKGVYLTQGQTFDILSLIKYENYDTLKEVKEDLAKINGGK